MAHQGRQPLYQEAPYQYRPETYAGQQNEYNRSHANERSYSHNQHEQQWQQPQHDMYADDQQYSHAYGYDDRYDQNANGYHGQQYAQQQYQEERSVPQPQPQQQPRPQQARQYQYDERYRDNGHVTQSQAAGGRRSPPAQSRPGTSASSRRVKQDRILDTLESPKAVPWDNPFGAFPGVKKKTKEADESRSQSITDTTAGRPSTSSSNRAPAPVTSKKQSIEESRPHTSHGRQQQQPANVSNNSFDPPLSPTGAMPLRKKPPTDYHEDYTQYTPSATQAPRSQAQALPMRPAVQRSATVPLPETSPSTPDARFMPQTMGRYSTEQQRVGASRINEAPGHEGVGLNASSYDSRQLDQRYQQNESVAYSAPPASNGRTSRERPPQDAYTPSHAPQDPYHSPQGVSGNAATSNNRFSDRVPNFAADNSNPSNVIDRELGLQKNAEHQEIKPQIYRKPTYGDMDSRPPQIRPDLASPQSSYSSPTNNVSTPTGGFDFGLPPPNDNRYHSPQNGRPRQLEDEAGYVNQQQQFPPRSGSRIPPQAQRPANGFSHPYNQPPRKHEQGARPTTTTNAPPQRQPPLRQEYGFDEQGYPQQYPPHGPNSRPIQPGNDLGRWDQPQGHRPLARTYTAPVGQPGDDNYNHGYEQRNAVEPAQPPLTDYDAHQPRSDSMRPGLEPGYDRARDMPPPRPRTANSSRAPPQQYYNQPMPGQRPPNSDYAVGDRNHPVPIRPGLMEEGARPMPPAAPALTPVPQQISPPRSLPSSNQHMRQPSDTASPKPVTIQELNELRNALKERPNDDKLGLKFAKRLVEAGTVLASEGGKADPKTTAKNRERYVNDAYRTIKKLVANNSAEAIFYLADCYGSGQLGLEVNAKEAFQLYTTAAKLGHAQSTYRVAVCCELGPDGGGGTRRDHFKAVQFYKKAATLGDGPAMFKMGMILLKGLLGAQPNRREGISWLKRAAERADQENPHALHELASLYENAASTDVIIRDERYAMQLYTEAANLGYKYSQWRLGSAYEYGTLGVQIDPRQSIGWYTRAAAQGEHQSEFALSGWYLTGSEPLLAQSDQEAYLWARKAASSGLSKAEYAMGYYTEVGIGCRSDIEEAKKWYFRAAAQSDNRAKERLEEIKRGGARKEKTRISRTNVGRQNEGECSVM